MEFAQNLKSVMESKSITMYRLAKELGIHQTTIKNWLEGKGEPRISEVHAIAAALNVDFYSLASWDQALAEAEEHGPPPPPPTPKERVDTAFWRLNADGQKAAALSLEMIAMNPKYQRTPPQDGGESTPAPQEGKDTTLSPDSPEPPPEGE